MNKIFKSIKFLLLLTLFSVPLTAIAIDSPGSINIAARTCGAVTSDIQRVEEIKQELLADIKSTIEDFNTGKISLASYLHALQEHISKIKEIAFRHQELKDELLVCEKGID